MDTRFLPHNAHLDGIRAFEDRDPQLRLLAGQPLVHLPPLLGRLPRGTPGIYTIGGGRQIGKTTLLKQWMHSLLSQGVDPSRIAFFSGELIDDHHALVRLLSDQLSAMPFERPRFLLIDEVSYIRGWDRGVKFLADAGMLDDAIVMLTGSDLAFIQEARMHFPGRRGSADLTDFHVFPLSFREVVSLRKRVEEADVDPAVREGPTPGVLDVLFEEFDRYLVHGGFLTAINDMEREARIRASTLATYSEGIRGDVLKRGKHEHSLREVLDAIIRRYGTQVSWNALAKDLSIDHPATVADYVQLLATMDAVFIQPALVEDKLAPAPKKPKKVMFTDPFIFHAIRCWLHPAPDPFEERVVAATRDPEWTGRLAEACVATHFRRLRPTYYIKAEGEVDVATIHEGRFWPIEVKWTGQVRVKDLKQIRKYANGVIWSRAHRASVIGGVRYEPLPLALMRLG